MPQISVSEIVRLAGQLTPADRLILIERLAAGLRLQDPVSFDDEMDAMAADPDIQREICAINAETQGADLSLAS